MHIQTPSDLKELVKNSSFELDTENPKAQQILNDSPYKEILIYWGCWMQQRLETEPTPFSKIFHETQNDIKRLYQLNDTEQKSLTQDFIQTWVQGKYLKILLKSENTMHYANLFNLIKNQNDLEEKIQNEPFQLSENPKSNQILKLTFFPKPLQYWGRLMQTQLHNQPVDWPCLIRTTQGIIQITLNIPTQTMRLIAQDLSQTWKHGKSFSDALTGSKPNLLCRFHQKTDSFSVKRERE